jgi:hypothetical protein
MTRDAYRPRFDETAHLQGKTLVIIMVPLFALAGWAMYRRIRPYFVEHLIFAFYAFAFLLIWIGVTAVLETRLIMISAQLGYRPGPDLIERGSSAAALVPFAAYLYLASRRVYGQGVWMTLLKAVSLAAWLMVVLMAYRMILFFTTFYAT